MKADKSKCCRKNTDNMAKQKLAVSNNSSVKSQRELQLSDEQTLIAPDSSEKHNELQLQQMLPTSLYENHLQAPYDPHVPIQNQPLLPQHQMPRLSHQNHPMQTVKPLQEQTAPVSKCHDELAIDIEITRDVCNQIIDKLNTLMVSDEFKTVKCYNEVKDLRLHLSYLHTYAISRFNGLQEKSNEEIKKLVTLSHENNSHGYGKNDLMQEDSDNDIIELSDDEDQSALSDSIIVDHSVPKTTNAAAKISDEEKSIPFSPNLTLYDPERRNTPNIVCDLDHTTDDTCSNINVFNGHPVIEIYQISNDVDEMSSSNNNGSLFIEKDKNDDEIMTEILEIKKELNIGVIEMDQVAIEDFKRREYS